MTFRAGDHVLHKPSGETWVLACDEERGEVICCGWPESFAKAADCELVDAVSDEYRRELLLRVARSCSDQTRGSRALEQLAKGADPPCCDCIVQRADVIRPATRRTTTWSWCAEHYTDELHSQSRAVAAAKQAFEVVDTCEVVARQGAGDA